MDKDEKHSSVAHISDRLIAWDKAVPVIISQTTAKLEPGKQISSGV